MCVRAGRAGRIWRVWSFRMWALEYKYVYVACVRVCVYVSVSACVSVGVRACVYVGRACQWIDGSQLC